jgi:hypothetical protein
MATSDGEKALASDANPKIATLTISTGFRPNRSPSGPDNRAPAMTPRFDHKKATAKADGAIPQAWVSDGTAQPIEPTSSF